MPSSAPFQSRLISAVKCLASRADSITSRVSSFWWAALGLQLKDPVITVRPSITASLWCSLSPRARRGVPTPSRGLRQGRLLASTLQLRSGSWVPRRSRISLKDRLAKPGSASRRMAPPWAWRVARASAIPCSDNTKRARSTVFLVVASSCWSSTKPWLGSLRRCGANSTPTRVGPTITCCRAPSPLATPKRLFSLPPGPSPHIRSNSAANTAASSGL